MIKKVKINSSYWCTHKKKSWPWNHFIYIHPLICLATENQLLMFWLPWRSTSPAYPTFGLADNLFCQRDQMSRSLPKSVTGMIGCTCLLPKPQMNPSITNYFRPGKRLHSSKIFWRLTADHDPVKRHSILWYLFKIQNRYSSKCSTNSIQKR